MFWTTKVVELKGKEGVHNVKVMIMWIQPSWFKLFPKSMFFVDLKDM